MQVLGPVDKLVSALARDPFCFSPGDETAVVCYTTSSHQRSERQNGPRRTAISRQVGRAASKNLERERLCHRFSS